MRALDAGARVAPITIEITTAMVRAARKSSRDEAAAPYSADKPKPPDDADHAHHNIDPVVLDRMRRHAISTNAIPVLNLAAGRGRRFA
jgi:hypothetical protein